MKAITICQPYAELIASGAKRVENRTWATSYRGELAIHAGKSRKFGGTDGMVYGAVVAIARLTRIVWVESIPMFVPPHPEFSWLLDHVHVEGPWCWILEGVQRVKPFACRGDRGVWELCVTRADLEFA